MNGHEKSCPSLEFSPQLLDKLRRFLQRNTGLDGAFWKYRRVKLGKCFASTVSAVRQVQIKEHSGKP
jgi:hypothetical protein